uniref:Neurexin-3-like n=2 Tax=Diabrotica virgifera virgifera TaxID=50390 RepID=A0A6P7GSL8_DIAVI
KAPSEAVFRGTEFLSYDLSQTGGEPIVSAQDSVIFYFKTRQPNGLLFYTGDGNDYLNVAIKDGILSLTMGLSNGKQEMQIKPNKVRFDDNQWHKVSIHRRIQEVSAYSYWFPFNVFFTFMQKFNLYSIIVREVASNLARVYPGYHEWIVGSATRSPKI